MKLYIPTPIRKLRSNILDDDNSNIIGIMPYKYIRLLSHKAMLKDYNIYKQILEFIVENYIKTSLTELFPDAELICEESADNCTINNNNGLKFIVDPLDGTTNYTNGWPHTVAIGIVNNNELIGGIIYDALQNKIYTGIKGYGVTECNINNISEQIKVKTPQYPHYQIKKSPISYDTPYGSEAYKVTQAFASEL